MLGILLIRENGRLCSGNRDRCASRWSAPNILKLMIRLYRIPLDSDRPSHGSTLVTTSSREFLNKALPWRGEAPTRVVRRVLGGGRWSNEHMVTGIL